MAKSMKILRVTFIAILAAFPTGLLGSIGGQQVRFQGGVSRVTIAVVVRDSQGRPVRGLSAHDFEVRDQGMSRPITDFQHEISPISIAMLLDTSGSMRVGPKLERASEFAHLLLATLTERKDEAALFAFEHTVHAVHDFTDRFDPLRKRFASVRAFGSTSLYDAIAETAQQVGQRPGRHAVVVLTDGIDTSSRLTAPEVSGIASAIDVPVYLVAVGLAIDVSDEARVRPEIGTAKDLAQWTGGRLHVATSAAESSIVAREIVEDLRHQYVLGLDSSDVPGWHRLEVRVRQRVAVQARSGYWVGTGPSIR